MNYIVPLLCIRPSPLGLEDFISFGEEKLKVQKAKTTTKEKKSTGDTEQEGQKSTTPVRKECNLHVVILPLGLQQHRPLLPVASIAIAPWWKDSQVLTGVALSVPTLCC